MHLKCTIPIIAAALGAGGPAGAIDLGLLRGKGPWNLPVVISDERCSVTFEISTTFHDVAGVAKRVSGKVEASGAGGITASLTLPVRAMSTGNASRDEKMYTVMHAAEHPNVEARLRSVPDFCDPPRVDGGEPCRTSLSGEIKISGVSRPVTVPVEVTKRGSSYIVTGRQTIDRRDFGVDDPSTFLAKVDPKVEVEFRLEL